MRDLEVLLAEQHVQHPAGFRDLVAGNEITRRLRNGEGQHAVDDRGDHHHQEHPAPGVEAEPQRSRWHRPRCVCSRVVDGERQEDAGARSRAAAASPAGRGCAAARSRRCRRARSPRRRRRRCRRRCGRARRCSTSGANAVPMALMKNNTAAIFITEMRPILSAMRPGRHGAAAAPSSAEATAKPNSVVADAEVFLDRVDGTVDDGAVVAEQQAAQRGDATRCGRRCGPRRSLRREIADGLVGYGWTLTGHGGSFRSAA